MALMAFLIVGAVGLVTLRDSDGFQSKTELLSEPNADSPSCVSAGCDVDNVTSIYKSTQTQKSHVITTPSLQPVQ